MPDRFFSPQGAGKLAQGTTLIKGGTVIDPANGINALADVLIEDGRIADVVVAADGGIGEDRAQHVIDATGQHVLPGFIELGARFREPGGGAAENIETGTLAAAMGGYTTVCVTPETKPTIDEPSLVKFILARAMQGTGVRVRPLGAVTHERAGEALTDYASLLEAGVIAFTDAGSPLQNAATMRRALENARDLGAVIMQEPRDNALVGKGVMHEGDVSMHMGLHGIPRIAESTMTLRDAALSLETGGRLHISQLSNEQGVDAVRHFKSRGAPVTAAVSPHHLTFTEEDMLPWAKDGLWDVESSGFDTVYKVLPPLCAQSDRSVLIEALRDGTIDCISCAHTPCAHYEKDTVFDEAMPGMIGLESAFGALIAELVDEQGWPLERVVEKLTVGPARVLGVDAGTLSVGSLADICVWSLGENEAFTVDRLGSASSNCPWLGQLVRAKPVLTMVGGGAVWDAQTHAAQLEAEVVQ